MLKLVETMFIIVKFENSGQVWSIFCSDVYSEDEDDF